MSCTFVFCSYISARQFVVCFLRSLCLVRLMSMALTIFRDFLHLAGTTARCAPDGVLAALFPGCGMVCKGWGGVWGLLDVFFFSHRINRAFYMMNFRISGFAFCDQVCFCFRRDVSNLWIRYVPIKVPKF